MPKYPITYGVTLPFVRGQLGYFEASTDTLTQIKSNFINLVMTKKGERVHEPTFGCDLHGVVFEQNDDEMEDKTRDAVQEAVEAWMPFLVLRDFQFLNVDPDDLDRYRVRLYIKYGFTFNPNVFDEVVIEF